MYCQKCGCEVKDHNYCPECGECAPEHEETPAERSSSGKKSRFFFYLIFLGTLGLMIWGFYSLFNSGNGLEDLAETQLIEIKKNKITKAYYDYSSVRFKETNSLDSFREFIANNPGFREFTGIRFLDSRKDNNYGVVFGELIVFDDIAIPIKYEFVKEEGEWRVLKLQIDGPSFARPTGEKGGSGSAAVVQENPEQMNLIKEQLSVLKQGLIKKAYDQYSSDEFKSTTNFELFDKFIKQYPDFSDFEGVDTVDVESSKEKAKVTILLKTKKSSLPLEYFLINRNGQWKIWSMQVLKHAPEEIIADNAGEEKQMYGSINAFQNKISKNELDDAYNSTSPRFKNTTTKEQFESFLVKFPQLKNQVNFTGSMQDKNLGLVRGKLDEGKDRSLVDYIVTKENGDWKILGIEMLDKETAQPASPENDANDYDKSSLVEAINKQLNEIRNKNLFAAYEDYTSGEFKEATSFDNFAIFVSKNPLFSSNQSADFSRLTFDNNVATILMQFKTKTGAAGAVEYDLIKEGDKWKVLGIKIPADEEKTDHEKPKIKELK